MSEGVQTLAVELGGGLTPLSDGVSGRYLITNTQRRMELFEEMTLFIQNHDLK